MQNTQSATATGVSRLLTARQVQSMLHVDRSTVYRMAEDGRLPAIKVGRQWRFPAARIVALLDADAASDVASGATGASGAHSADLIALATSTSTSTSTPTPTPIPMTVAGGPSHPAPSDPAAQAAAIAAAVHSDPAFIQTAEAVLTVSADLLGVMMVVTDMDGAPLTAVANPCDWFVDRADDPETVSACTAEWQSMADDPDFVPRFRTGVLGFQCARAFIRAGACLVGMVLAGGVAPNGESGSAATEPASGPAGDGLYHLTHDERRAVLAALPKVAAALSRVPVRGSDGLLISTTEPIPRSTP
jgi:excisionase family DNA binding protein